MSTRLQRCRDFNPAADFCNHLFFPVNWHKSSATYTVQLAPSSRRERVDVSAYTLPNAQVLKNSSVESLIAQRYTCHATGEVSRFIHEHLDIAQTLVDAIPRIEEFFGKRVVVSLNLSYDQESDPILSANIQTHLGVSEARAARKAFNTSWWMRQPNTDKLPLTFNLEYV